MTRYLTAADQRSGEARSASSPMKIVVIGGSGLIGSKLVKVLAGKGHRPQAASPSTGVDTCTGAGLDEALQSATVVVDVSNAPSFEDSAVRTFFETSTRNLLASASRAGVRHYVALSVVGADQLPQSGYMRAKMEQERLIRESSVSFTIVRATQFFEFVKAIGDAATLNGVCRVSTARFQPMAADDVASELAVGATAEPRMGTVEVAGPEAFRMVDLVQRVLEEHDDAPEIVADPEARYFGAELSER